MSTALEPLLQSYRDTGLPPCIRTHGQVSPQSDHDHAGSTGALHGIHDEFQEIITTKCHSNEGEWSLKTIFCRGGAVRIRALVYPSGIFDTVRRVTFMC